MDKHVKYMCTAICGIILIGFSVFPVWARDKEACETATLAIIVPVAPIDDRATKLKGYLMQFQSPLADSARTFVRSADENNLDWRLVAAIAGLESTYGKNIPQGSYNAWGWGVYTGQSYGARFSSWDDGIRTVSHGLKERYIDRGAQTVAEIGKIYATSPTWASRVNFIMSQIERYRPEKVELIELTL